MAYENPTTAKVEELKACPNCGQVRQHLHFCQQEAVWELEEMVSELEEKLQDARRPAPPAPAPQPEGDAKANVPTKKEREADLKGPLYDNYKVVAKYIAALEYVESELAQFKRGELTVQAEYWKAKYFELQKLIDELPTTLWRLLLHL